MIYTEYKNFNSREPYFDSAQSTETVEYVDCNSAEV